MIYLIGLKIRNTNIILVAHKHTESQLWVALNHHHHYHCHTALDQYDLYLANIHLDNMTLSSWCSFLQSNFCSLEFLDVSARYRNITAMPVKVRILAALAINILGNVSASVHKLQSYYDITS